MVQRAWDQSSRPHRSRRSCTIFTLGRIAAADGKQTINDSEILENLLTARVDALAPRAAEGLIKLLDKLESNVPTRELNRQRKAVAPAPQMRTSVSNCVFMAESRSMCIMHIYH
jgi:hypothetical protein